MHTPSPMEQTVLAQNRTERARAHQALDEAISSGRAFLAVPASDPNMATTGAEVSTTTPEEYYRHHYNEAMKRLDDLFGQIGMLKDEKAKVLKALADASPKSDFERAANFVGKLVTAKNEQYGDSAAVTGTMLQVLFPKGIPVAKYGEAMLIVRVLDKLCRISRGNQGDENAWQDIAGYAVLGMVQSAKVAYCGQATQV